MSQHDRRNRKPRRPRRSRDRTAVPVTPEELTRLTRALNEFMVAGECVLCGGLPAAMGVFDVDLALSRRLLAAPGRFIRYGYTMCKACHDRPDRDERFHAALVALAEAMERQAAMN